MARIIKGFHELCLPISDSGAGNKDWCTHFNGYTGNNSQFYYLLNNGSRLLGDLLDGLIPAEFYFDTEVKCHEAMAAYYRSHGTEYPYMDEWSAAIAANMTTTRKVHESQVMRFE